MSIFVERLMSALLGILGGIRDCYRLGGKAFIEAPTLVLLVAVPELAQHIAEITMGMFDNRAAAHALGRSAFRMDFGYIKLAGLVMAVLMLTRFWAQGGSMRRTVLMRPRVLVWVLLGVVILAGGGEVLVEVARRLPEVTNVLVQSLSAVFQAACLVWIAGALAEDPDLSLRYALTTRLPTALVTAILLGSAIVPCQILHGLSHKLAIGAPHAVVWALMVFDAMVVGSMASLAGAALFVGYQLGATWRGWACGPL